MGTSHETSFDVAASQPSHWQEATSGAQPIKSVPVAMVSLVLRSKGRPTNWEEREPGTGMGREGSDTDQSLRLDVVPCAVRATCSYGMSDDEHVGRAVQGGSPPDREADPRGARDSKSPMPETGMEEQEQQWERDPQGYRPPQGVDQNGLVVSERPGVAAPSADHGRASVVAASHLPPSPPPSPLAAPRSEFEASGALDTGVPSAVAYTGPEVQPCISEGQLHSPGDSHLLTQTFSPVDLAQANDSHLQKEHQGISEAPDIPEEQTSAMTQKAVRQKVGLTAPQKPPSHPGTNPGNFPTQPTTTGSRNVCEGTPPVARLASRIPSATRGARASIGRPSTLHDLAGPSKANGRVSPTAATLPIPTVHRAVSVPNKRLETSGDSTSTRPRREVRGKTSESQPSQFLMRPFGETAAKADLPTSKEQAPTQPKEKMAAGPTRAESKLVEPKKIDAVPQRKPISAGTAVTRPKSRGTSVEKRSGGTTPTTPGTPKGGGTPGTPGTPSNRGQGTAKTDKHRVALIRTPPKSPGATKLNRPTTTAAVDLKNVKSKIGSTENIKHQPKGGKVKIEDKPLDLSSVRAKCGSMDNMKHVPTGGQVQILSKKLDLSHIHSKCGSKGNLHHKPGGGRVRIENHKVQFKDAAQSKIGSLANIEHSPGGGNVKIESHKLSFRDQAQARTDHGAEIITVSPDHQDETSPNRRHSNISSTGSINMVEPKLETLADDVTAALAKQGL
uniref:microtubule-associated protein tau-like isoform X1 n=1 Tax=Myxine glutinosa TaxID=7769 RepID=UPI00358E47C7